MFNFIKTVFLIVIGSIIGFVFSTKSTATAYYKACSGSPAHKETMSKFYEIGRECEYKRMMRNGYL